uniref:Uncharacterized protein n=1 Tax=Arundo donax TaxID=35708 RepID=A0A0A9B8F5_ARUDO
MTNGSRNHSGSPAPHELYYLNAGGTIWTGNCYVLMI